MTAQDLLELGAGNKGYPGAEVGVTAQVAPGGYSGIERQRSVIISQSVIIPLLRFQNALSVGEMHLFYCYGQLIEILPRLVEHIEYVKQLWIYGVCHN